MVHLHVSVLMTSTPGNWSSGSQNCTKSSHLWPIVLRLSLLCAEQLPPYWYWPGYKGSIQGRAPYREGILKLGPNSRGRTSVLYAVWRIPWCLVWICLRTNSRVLLAFLVKIWICVFQLRPWLMLRMIYCLKNLAMQNILVPNWGTCQGNMQNLLGLNSISESFPHVLWRSCWRLWQSALLIIVKYTAVTSANSLTSEWIFSNGSLIYNRNKIGLKTKPWGNPRCDRDFGRFFPVPQPE